MTTKTELQQLKRLVFSLKDYSDRINGAEANQMVQGACFDAFEGLEDDERRVILSAVQDLKDEYPKLGDKGALELIAAMGDFIAHNEVKK